MRLFCRAARTAPPLPRGQKSRGSYKRRRSTLTKQTKSSGVEFADVCDIRQFSFLRTSRREYIGSSYAKKRGSCGDPYSNAIAGNESIPGDFEEMLVQKFIKSAVPSKPLLF